MADTRRKILEMLKEGKISVEDAERLLRGERAIVLEMLKEGKLSVEDADRLLRAIETGKEPRREAVEWEGSFKEFAQKVTGVGRQVGDKIKGAWDAATKEAKAEEKFKEAKEAFKEMGKDFRTWLRKVKQQVRERVPFGKEEGKVVSEATMPSEGIKRLEIRNLFGNILIEPNGETITARASSPPEKETKGQIVTFQDGELARIEVKAPEGEAGARINLIVQVPGGIALFVEAEHGSVEGADLTNDVTVKTVNGSVRISDLDGKVDVETANGSIRLTDLTGSVRAVGQNGAVSIEDVQGEVSAQSSNGPVSLIDIEGKATVKCANGRVSLESITGDVTVESGGGSVRLEDVEGDVSIKATSGSVRVDEGSGKRCTVQVERGSIEMEEADFEEISAQTTEGRIRLGLEDGFEGTLDARCTEQGNIHISLPAANCRIEAKTEMGHVVCRAEVKTEQQDAHSLIATMEEGTGKVTLHTKMGRIEIE